MKLSDLQARRDLVKFAIVALALLGIGAVFFVNPTLSTPTLLSVIITMLFSPLVASLERRGYPRIMAILIFFSLGGALFALLGIWTTQALVSEWKSFQEKAPDYFLESVHRLSSLEAEMKTKYPFLQNLSPTEKLMSWGKETGNRFLANGPAILGDLLTWIFIVPIIAFFLLKDGRLLRKKFFELVPNRFFESAFIIWSRVSDSMSDYIRAKIIEAVLVGLMVSVGLWLVDAPYSLVLGIIAGITNIVPYIGPFIGAAPGLLVAFFDPAAAGLFVPILLVYLIANTVDMAFIFPILVAKLVNLHPLVLITVVILGQQHYGLIGMLISIPLAAAFKVIFQEIHAAIYQPVKPGDL